MKMEKRLNELERQKNSLLNEKLAIERRHVERAKMEAKRQELEDAVQVSKPKTFSPFATDNPANNV
jgi:hypothetical protein